MGEARKIVKVLYPQCVLQDTPIYTLKLIKYSILSSLFPNSLHVNDIKEGTIEHKFDCFQRAHQQ